MIEDKISQEIKKIGEIKEKLKGIKKDIKEEEKIDNDQHRDLKKMAKDAKQQLKDFEEEFLKDLQTDEMYNKLREMKIQKEEELAQTYEHLFEHINKLPQKLFMLNLETESGMMRVQVQPEMRVYVNGKEEKPKF